MTLPTPAGQADSAAPSSPGELWRLDLRYVGTAYEGWQSQPSGRAVQDHLERALATILRHPVRVTGASRTDSGVHAAHQVVTFRTPVPGDAHRWLKSLQGILPRDIGVMTLAPAPSAFHPVLGARLKVYRYLIGTSPWRNPYLEPFCWSLGRALDMGAMAAAASTLTGTHDYTSFCAVDSAARTKVRTVRRIDLRPGQDLLAVTVAGEGFLKQMVRTMVGAMVEAGLGRCSPADVAAMLAARDRREASATAPAAGLMLLRIFYDEPAPGELEALLAGALPSWPVPT